jgi:hypothetical protein
MSSVRVLVGTKKGALILTKQEILDSKADPGLPAAPSNSTRALRAMTATSTHSHALCQERDSSSDPFPYTALLAWKPTCGVVGCLVCPTPKVS